MSGIMRVARRWLEAFSTAEISSRSLGLLRILGVLTIYIEFASPWVSHRMDDLLGTLLLSWFMFIAAWFVILGFKTRIASIVLALAFGGLHLYYGVETGIATLAAPVQEFQFLVLIAFTPAGRSLSIDRVLEVKRAKGEGREPWAERMPWWQLELFVILTASMYLWIAYESAKPTWLSGAQIEHDLIRLWSGSDLLTFAPAAHTMAVVVAWAVLLTSGALAFGLLSRRLRPYLVWGGIVLQYVALSSFIESWLTSYHNLMMMVMLIACFRPNRLHEFITLQGDREAESRPGGPSTEDSEEPLSEDDDSTSAAVEAEPRTGNVGAGPLSGRGDGVGVAGDR